MYLLLDTSVFLWWNLGAGALNPAARSAIADPTNAVHVSTASIWEIAIKRARGKLAFERSPAAALVENGFAPLPVTVLHAERAGGLVWDHPDPFDRMLVAQAQADGLTLVHADETIRGFAGVVQLWAR